MRVPQALDLEGLTHAAGYKAVSRYVADVLCEAHGRLDLIVGPEVRKEQDQQHLQLGA